MKKTKKLLVTLCFCLITALMLPAIVPNMEYVSTYQAATKVKLNKTKAYVTKGDKLTLKITGTDKKVKWSSSNKKIATVSSKGIVKGVKKGTATITAKVNGKTFKCKVTVETPKISKSKASVNKGKTITLSIKNTKQTVKWSSSNKKIATVSSKGVVKGIKKGTATITAKVGNKKYTCKVTVKNKNVEEPKIEFTPITSTSGKIDTFKFRIKNIDTREITIEDSVWVKGVIMYSNLVGMINYDTIILEAEDEVTLAEDESEVITMTNDDYTYEIKDGNTYYQFRISVEGTRFYYYYYPESEVGYFEKIGS